MTDEAAYYVERILFQRRVGCKPTDTLASADAKVLKKLSLDEDDATQIKRRLSDASQADLDKANRKQMECVGNDPFGFEAEARKKRVEKSLAREKRIKRPGSVDNPIDGMGSPQEREALVRRFDLEDARALRASPPPVDDDALDVEKGTIDRPIDLTKNTERFSFGRVSRAKARGPSAKKTKRAGAKGRR